MKNFEHCEIFFRYYDGIASPSNVHIQKCGLNGGTDWHVEVPMQALVAFVARLVSDERIRRLEQASPLEIFGLEET